LRSDDGPTRKPHRIAATMTAPSNGGSPGAVPRRHGPRLRSARKKRPAPPRAAAPFHSGTRSSSTPLTETTSGRAGAEPQGQKGGAGRRAVVRRGEHEASGEGLTGLRPAIGATPPTPAAETAIVPVPRSTQNVGGAGVTSSSEACPGCRSKLLTAYPSLVEVRVRAGSGAAWGRPSRSKREAGGARGIVIAQCVGDHRRERDKEWGTWLGWAGQVAFITGVWAARVGNGVALRLTFGHVEGADIIGVDLVKQIGHGGLPMSNRGRNLAEKTCASSSRRAKHMGRPAR